MAVQKIDMENNSMPKISDTTTIIITRENTKNVTKIGDRTFPLDYENCYEGYPKLIIQGKNDQESKENTLYIIKYLEFYKFIDNSDRVIPISSKRGRHYICGFDFEKFTGESLSSYL